MSGYFPPIISSFFSYTNNFFIVIESTQHESVTFNIFFAFVFLRFILFCYYFLLPLTCKHKPWNMFLIRFYLYENIQALGQLYQHVFVFPIMFLPFFHPWFSYLNEIWSFFPFYGHCQFHQKIGKNGLVHSLLAKLKTYLNFF